MRRVLLTIVVVCSATVGGVAQQPASPRFEVASIKLWQPPTTPLTSVRVAAAPPGSDRFNSTNTVAGLIAYAYDVRDHQLSGGPDWVRAERYEVAARAGREVSQAERRAMVKTLLEDRFKLRVRTETREMPILELRLARSDGRVGPNLHDCSNPNDKGGISTPEKPFRAPTGGGVAVSDCASGLTNLSTIASRQLQATVVDKTGLTGQWRFNVYYGSEPTIPGIQGTANPDLPSFVTALQEQLGLKVEGTRGPVPVVVIESVDRPTPD
jgi:uncharacterized protein (TIGR03435 family)